MKSRIRQVAGREKEKRRGGGDDDCGGAGISGGWDQPSRSILRHPDHSPPSLATTHHNIQLQHHLPLYLLLFHHRHHTHGQIPFVYRIYPAVLLSGFVSIQLQNLHSGRVSQSCLAPGFLSTHYAHYLSSRYSSAQRRPAISNTYPLKRYTQGYFIVHTTQSVRPLPRRVLRLLGRFNFLQRS